MVRKFGHAEDPKDRIHFSNAGFSTCGCDPISASNAERENTRSSYQTQGSDPP